MKKTTIMLIFVVTLCLLLTGCGVETPSDENFENNEAVSYEYSDLDEEEIKEPVVDWWKVYKNINKVNCVTLQVSNPNKFPIQFSYDLVYYKNNQVVKTENHWAMTCIEPNKSGIIYGHIDIPSPDNVDRVELENIDVSKFEWKLLSGTFTKTFIDKGVQHFDVKFPESPRHTEIWAVLYNDTNADKKIQANEFVEMGILAPFVGIYEKEGEIQIPVPDERLMYTDYQIYCVAFTTESSQ